MYWKIGGIATKEDSIRNPDFSSSMRSDHVVTVKRSSWNNTKTEMSKLPNSVSDSLFHRSFLYKQSKVIYKKIN